MSVASCPRGAKTLNATVDQIGDDFLVTLPTAGTSTPACGRYVRADAATKGEGRYTVGTGELEVTPGIATAADGQLQSHKE